MKSRIITGVVGISLMLIVLLVLPPIALNIVIAALCGIAMYELLHAAQIKHLGVTVLSILFAVSTPFLLLATTPLLAVGVLVISLTTGMTTDVDNYMFGSVLAMTKGDVALSVILSVTVLTLYLLFYHQIFAVTFDESFSRATGLKVDACNTLLAILTALTIVLGMRMMGAMLISSLVIFPALTAMRLFKSFRGVILCAAVTSVVCFCVGLTISFGFSTPVGATVVAADLTVFLAACLLAALRRK